MDVLGFEILDFNKTCGEKVWTRWQKISSLFASDLCFVLCSIYVFHALMRIYVSLSLARSSSLSLSLCLSLCVCTCVSVTPSVYVTFHFSLAHSFILSLKATDLVKRVCSFILHTATWFTDWNICIKKQRERDDNRAPRYIHIRLGDTYVRLYRTTRYKQRVLQMAGWQTCSHIFRIYKFSVYAFNVVWWPCSMYAFRAEHALSHSFSPFHTQHHWIQCNVWLWVAVQASKHAYNSHSVVAILQMQFTNSHRIEANTHRECTV